MAACRPKLKTPHPGADLFLSRFAEGEWGGIVRPWLEARRGALERALVVVPTRGQAQSLKQRCLGEGVSLLGVEFLTPGLARRKLGSPPPLGRSLQLLVLRDRIEARLSSLAADDPARGLWMTLDSDADSALDDFEELLLAGFDASHFARAELAEVFGELADWVSAHGYQLGPLQDRAGALGELPPDVPRVADRLLILAGGPENWPDFFGLVALTRRCPAVCVTLADPEFTVRDESCEKWVEEWERALGVANVPIDEEEPAESCAGVAELLSGGTGSADRAAIIVAESKAAEMALVADEVARLLAAGSENIAVILPRGGAAHARLLGLLESRGIPYADLIGAAGTPPEDTRIQRAMADFYDRGCRLEELLGLWPLLRALNITDLELGKARKACAELFDEVQAHGVEPHIARLESARDEESREVGRIARLLMPGWPARLAPGDALGLFEQARDRLGLSEPAGWAALREFASGVPEPMPARALLEAIRSFLPEKGPLATAAKSTFARATITTCRRAAGVAWSDCIFTGANAGIWPERREPSCWLGDDARRLLEGAPRPFSLGLPTSESRASIERRLYCAIARDTRRRVTFSESVFDEEDPETRLDPNAWLERVMWKKGLPAEARTGRRASGTPARSTSAAGASGETPGLGAWHSVWKGRRDPGRPFDEYFLGDPQGAFRPRRLSASQIQAGAIDPSTLWFGAVLGVRRIDWSPFTRARKKSIGVMVHRALRSALGGTPAEGEFSVMPDRADAARRLEAELALLRARWPADRYWESFLMDVSRAARELLGRVY
jgi:hypothetical protein